MEAITREEKIISGENLTPITRKELFLAKAAGQDVKTPTPITREEMFLSKISSGGTASGENKLVQLVDGTLTEITAEDLEGITSIRQYAFSYCTELKKVILPNTITEIPSYMFDECLSLTNISIPNTVEKIGMRAFYRCLALTDLTIPSGVQTIGFMALYCGNSTNKAIFTFLGTTPPTIDSTAFNGNQMGKIIVPKGCGDVYKSATNWSEWADDIEEATE